MEEGLLEIRPPRLEDAGLEDCALPLESIKEAFLKAASAVRSTLSHSDHDAEGSCVDDPWLVTGDPTDSLVGIADGVDGSPGCCVTEKRPELTGDEVVVAAGAGEKEERSDALLAPGLPEGGGSCVDALEGLSIGDTVKKTSKKTGNQDDGDDGQNEDGKTEKPILVEDFA